MARRIIAPPPAPPSRIAALEAAIVEDPDDVATHLVLADALLEAGDPRGELIVAQVEDHAARARELSAQFGSEIASLAGVPVQLDWRYGFVQRMSATLAAGEPIREPLAAALAHPCMRVLAGLVVRCGVLRGTDAIDAIAAVRRPNLRALAIEEELGDSNEGRVDRETSALWAQLPRLERLRLRSERALFDRIDHPRVRSMRLEVSPFTARFEWKLPALESLDWDTHWLDCDTGAVDSLWRQELPALRDVTLHGFFVGPGLLANPSARRFLRGIDRLCVPDRLLVGDRDELLAALARNADMFAHLSRLVVSRSLELYDADDVAAVQRALPNLELQAGSSSL